MFVVVLASEILTLSRQHPVQQVAKPTIRKDGIYEKKNRVVNPSEIIMDESENRTKG